MAGLFISAIAVLPQAVSFTHVYVSFFHWSCPTFKICEPKSVDLPVVAHLQHGWKSGVGVLGKAMDLLSGEIMWLGDPIIPMIGDPRPIISPVIY